MNATGQSVGSDLMCERFVGRQPIFDDQQQLFGYELLFRSGDVNAANPVCGDSATDDVLDMLMNVMGLEVVTGGSPAFINITRQTLLERRYEILPPKSVVLELLEDVQPDRDVIAACQELKQAGYRLALDDLVSVRGMEPLLELADIVKVDFCLAEPQDCHEVVNLSSTAGYKTLAEKVETQDEFQQALSWGYDYFQGYFFQQPDVLREMVLRPSAQQSFQLLSAVSVPDVDFGEIEEIIKRDVGLSTRFFRFINSSSFGFRAEIASVRHAVTMLGESAMRRWVTLLSLQQLSTDRPTQLMLSSLVRARMCETLADPMGMEHRKLDLFMLGLLSLMDALLCSDLENVLDGLPIADDVRQALTDQTGPLQSIYQAVCAIEQNRIDDALEIAHQHGIMASDLRRAYTEASAWADQHTSMG